MRYVLVFFSLIVGVGLGYYFGYDIGFEKAAQLFEPKEEVAGKVVEKQWREYRNRELGFSFLYQIAPTRYIEVEAEDPDALLALALYEEAEWQEFLESTEAREGPSGIVVLVFENADGANAREWVEKNERSNFQFSLDQTIEPITAHSLEGARYQWSGLYGAESVVFANDNYIYMFSGAYVSPDDQILSDFRDIVQTFSLAELVAL